MQRLAPQAQAAIVPQASGARAVVEQPVDAVLESIVLVGVHVRVVEGGDPVAPRDHLLGRPELALRLSRRVDVLRAAVADQQKGRDGLRPLLGTNSAR